MKILEKLNLLVCVFLVSIICCGCASIVSDSKYPVAISSEPDDATFRVINRSGQTIFNGKTPTVVTLKSGDGYFKGADYKVIFEKSGYMPSTLSIASSFDTWYFGNCIFGGTDFFIGFLVIDPLTGAMWKLDENLYVKLVPEPVP